MKSRSTIITRLAAAVFLLTVIAPSVPAQSDNPDDERVGCEGAARHDRVRCVSGIVVPEAALLLPEDSGEARLRVSQIVQDLNYLRDVTGQLSRLASQSEPDVKAITQLASEIRKRAARLKESLALPSPEEAAEREGGEVPSDPARLRAALSALSALISEALRNPVLRGYVLDIPRAARARSCLEEIIALSERIRASGGPTGKGRR